MKSLLFASACGLILAGAVACAPRTPPPARVALDCPATQGDLTRTSVAPDQKTCLYTNRDGDQVSLRLVSAPAGYHAALAPIEQELAGEVQSDAEVDAAKAKQADADAKSAGADAKVASADCFISDTRAS